MSGIAISLGKSLLKKPVTFCLLLTDQSEVTKHCDIAFYHMDIDHTFPSNSL